MAGKRGNPNLLKTNIDNDDILGTKETIETEETIEETIKTEKKTEVKPIWKPDLQRMIGIKNISRGKLIYKSKRIVGYTVEWSNKGDVNYLELSEFINLKNSDRRFITEPWIRVVEDDEIEILKYAQVFDYYKEILGLNNVSDILKLSFEDFKKKFDKLPEGYKNAVMESAAEMISNGELDSLKIKDYIEKTMQIDLSILIQKDNKKDNYIQIK